MLINRAFAHSTRRLLAGALLVVFTLAACSAAAAPSPSPNPTAGPVETPRRTPTAVPGDPGGGNGTEPGPPGGCCDGGDPGNPGGGIVFPLPPDPNQNPLFGDANYVTPAVGLIDQRPVNVQLVRAIVKDNGTTTADLRWWSGVAPCNQLDHVEVARDEAAKTIHFNVVEGSGGGDIACIDLAELRATAVELGTLASGTWTISAAGDAPAIKLDVP
jgi:hypothetical protein